MVRKGCRGVWRLKERVLDCSAGKRVYHNSVFVLFDTFSSLSMHHNACFSILDFWFFWDSETFFSGSFSFVSGFWVRWRRVTSFSKLVVSFVVYVSFTLWVT